MKHILASLLLICAPFVSVPFSSIALGQKVLRDDVTTLTAHAGQLTRTQLESPSSNNQVQVNNRTNSLSDVDFVAVDLNGNEVGRETVTVDPKLIGKFTLQDIFPELVFNNVSTINVQVSVRPVDGERSMGKDKDLITPQAAQLAVAFFSQRDPRWSGNKLGTCSSTIGSEGCAITAIAMAGARSVTNFNPASLNSYLTSFGGYDQGCLVKWSVAAAIDGPGGFTYHGVGTGSVTSAANLKALIDGNKFVIAKSTRFYPSPHWGIIIGYYNQGTTLSDFYYLDPWDTSAVFRRVNDGMIGGTSATRIYQ